MNIKQNNANLSFITSLTNVNQLLDQNSPNKKLSEYKQKLKSKP